MAPGKDLRAYIAEGFEDAKRTPPLSPDDLAAIRARDADWEKRAEMVGLDPGSMTPAAADRRALLGEVDRLTADHDYWENLAATALPYPEADVLRERERIRSAVEGLTTALTSPGPHLWVPVDAVLRIIEGER